jgi:putative RecB family exonuclease
MNLYIQCSLKYRFQYIDNLPKPFIPSGLAFGSAIHSTLSWFHKERMNGNGVTLEKLYKIFDADWYSQRVDSVIHYKNGEEEMKLAVMAKEMLGLYFQNPLKEIKGTEVPFTVPLINPANGQDLHIDLEGIIDLVEKDDTIVEFKTSNQTMNVEDAKESLQLTIYSYAYEMLYRKPPKLLKLIDFVKTKKPKIVPLETKRRKTDYERLFHLASQVLRGIKEQVFFPRSSFWCSDCEYGRQCREWRGNGR